MIRHIKRDGSKTFCGFSFGVYRCSPQEAEKRKHYKKLVAPPHKEELPTGTYAQANCRTCKRSFNVLVRTIVANKNLHCFLNQVNHHIQEIVSKESA